jgi:CHAT domain-containing protein
LGLQRAFQVAGARSVIASLWKVPDQATERLMTDFYRNLWQKGLPPLEALRQAQIALLHSSSSAPGRPASPESWAAWVLSGSPAAGATGN